MELGVSLSVGAVFVRTCVRACVACVAQFYNDPGFSNVSHVAVVGSLGTLFSFSGFEASAHMAEDTNGARKVQSES